MASFNKVIMMGNLTRNPEIRYTPTGTPVASFGIATSRRFKQGDELKEEVCFVDCVAFGVMAENLARYLQKGDQLTIDGRLQQRRWETEDGQKRSKHEVVAEHIVYGNKKKGDGEQASSDGDPESGEPDYNYGSQSTTEGGRYELGASRHHHHFQWWSEPSVQ